MPIHKSIEDTNRLLEEYLEGIEKLGFTLEKIFNVPGIEDKIYSFLMTDKMYKEII